MEALIPQSKSIGKIVPAGKNVVARRKQGISGMLVISEALSNFVEPIGVAGCCASEWHELERYRLWVTEDVANERRKALHARLLPNSGQAHNASHAFQILRLPPDEPVTHLMAIQMLGVLYGTLGKRRKNEDETAILACADLFNPDDEVLGKATGLWKPVPKHPLILALAIKTRIAKSPFVSPSELRDEMMNVQEKLMSLDRGLDHWLEWMRTTDRHLFAHDRVAWEAAYTNVDSSTVLAMVPPVSKMDAYEAELDRIWSAKFEAEEGHEP
jgi:hypothetical protein